MNQDYTALAHEIDDLLGATSASPAELRAALQPARAALAEAQATQAQLVDCQNSLATLTTTHEQVAGELRSFKVLFENALDGIVIVDPKFQFRYANPAVLRMYGVSSQEEFQISSRNLVDQDILRQQAEALQKDGFWMGQVQFNHPDGRTRHWYSSLSRLTSIDGEVEGYVSINRDITVEYELEEERQRLQEQVIMAQQSLLRELSTPLIPIAEGIVIMPIIGSVDTQRAQEIMDTLLHGVSEHHATIVILDITGLKVVDTQVANGLISAAQAARLLGAQVVLTGISPEVAQTLVHLASDMRGIVPHSTLQSGFAFAMRRITTEAQRQREKAEARTQVEPRPA